VLGGRGGCLLGIRCVSLSLLSIMFIRPGLLTVPFLFCADTVTVGAVAVVISTIVLLAMLDMGEGITIFLVLAAFFSTLTCFVCLFLQCWGTSESKMIERELKAATKTEMRPHLD
jgi:hypothetical protein